MRISRYNDLIKCLLVDIVNVQIGLIGLIRDYQMPFEEEIGQYPTLEEMQDFVVNKKGRPILCEHWYAHQVGRHLFTSQCKPAYTVRTR